MLKLLDKILLGDDVVTNFYHHYQNLEFRNWLVSLLPEVEDCRTTNQDNPWHVYNCLEHILRSVEEINKQTLNLPKSERRLLAYSMFYHDMGKPATHIRRFAKAYGKEIDSFFNHNQKSAEIASRTAKLRQCRPRHRRKRAGTGRG